MANTNQILGIVKQIFDVLDEGISIAYDYVVWLA